MIYGSRIQLDDRPAIERCTLIYVDTNIESLSRVIVEISTYQDDNPECCQGIDLTFQELVELSKVLMEYFEGRAEDFTLEASWPPQGPVHQIRISEGIEGKLAFTVYGKEDLEIQQVQSVTAYIHRTECMPLALTIRACAEGRRLADKEGSVNRESGLEW